MQTSQEGFKISRGRTEIEVPHGEGEITFVLPSYGPGTFREVMPKIDNAGLLRATTAQTVSLIYQAFQHKNELECQDILEILNSPNRHLWTGTEDLVVDEGVFVYDNADGKMFGDRAFAEMYLLEDRASLEKMFNVKDETQLISLGPGDLSPEKQLDGQLSSVKAKKMIV